MRCHLFGPLAREIAFRTAVANVRGSVSVLGRPFAPSPACMTSLGE